MKRGKQTCKILKEIRKQIAEANDIEYIVSECQFQGDCLGTCPKCEAEVRYLEQQLEYKHIAGNAITILGISAGILTYTPNVANAQQKVTIDVHNIEVIQDSTWTNEYDQLKKDALQTNDSITNKDECCFGMVEQMPIYPGGIIELKTFLEQNIRYPDPTICITGYVIVIFKVNKDGSVSDAKVMRGIHPLFDKEALRVINSMPKWIPGKMYGKAIETRFTVPVSFEGAYTNVTKTEIIETGTNLNKESTILVKGKVMDDEGNPIIGATFCDAKNQNSGTVSDINGHFQFEIQRNHPLKVTYIGMKTQKNSLDKYNAPYMNVVLLQENNALMRATSILSN